MCCNPAVPIVHTGGTDLYFEQRGAGPRLVFLHGSGSTIDDSKLLISAFAPGFDLLVADYRGMGRSELSPRPYRMTEGAADALAIMDAVGWVTARVAGVSFGGMVAQELAVTAPERVERLALLCTSSGGAGGSSYPLHELEELPGSEQMRRRSRLLDTRFDDAWFAAHPGDRALAEMMVTRSGGDVPEHTKGRHEQLQARSTHDVWERLPSISCPTFVACGRFDGIAPPENSAAIASRIPGAELHAYDGGHAFLAQDPTSLPEVIGFLRAGWDPTAVSRR